MSNGVQLKMCSVLKNSFVKIVVLSSKLMKKGMTCLIHKNRFSRKFLILVYILTAERSSTLQNRQQSSTDEH